MSFQDKDFWMSKAPDGDSRTDPKRSQQWFMDGAEAEFFPNKKQAVEIPHPNSYTALLNSNISSWGNSSSFQSVSGFDETPPPITATTFDGRKVAVDPFGIDSTFGLSISHPLVESRPGITYSGIRKVKVNQVKEAEGFISVSLGHADDEPITTGLSFDRTNDSLISMADTFNMGVGTSDDNNNIAMDSFHEHSNTLLMDQVFSKDDGMIKNTNEISGLSMRHSFSKGGENNIISFGGINDDADNMNSSGRLVCSYDFLMGQPSVQGAEEKGLSESTSDVIVNGVQVIATVDAISKGKDQKGTKKAPPNNFPSNVRSLLSTGMLDGVSVKYVAWSREKELRGVIKGAAYLCGCQSCTFSKAINAYEFERHAGCKTKHPNNHIYFENGKTIYGVVQELRNTPQNMLFEAIQTITGSPINQKYFRLWKESFLAATRELQRIYGKEEGNIVS